MARDTKERIMDAALEIFARDGYEGTNIKDIAESVGIVKSALYRHFESKEAIWDAVITMISGYYEEHALSIDRLPAIPSATDELIEMTMNTVNFTVNDRRIVQVRKILQVEQYRDEKACEYANNYFLLGTEAVFTKLFSAMMENGAIRKSDPQMLALSYTAPITVLIHFCDRNPEKKLETTGKIERFIRSFLDEWKVC